MQLLKLLQDFYHDQRNNLLANKGFQHWATTFPLTRPTARKHASQLFDVCAGFVYTKVLYVFIELNLIELLSTRSYSTADLSTRLGISENRIQCYLNAAAALQLVRQRADGSYSLGKQGAVLIGNPAVISMVKHNHMFYRDLSDPVALLKDDYDTELHRYWHYANRNKNDAGAKASTKSYSELMAESQPLVAEQILEAFSLDSYKKLLDVGGGDGTFLRAVARQYPDLDLILFDLPEVTQIADEKFNQSDCKNSIDIVSGSFIEDKLPLGADIISLVRIIHDHNDDIVRILLKKVREALAPGGVLLLAEPMSGVSGAELMSDAYFGMYFLAMGQGEPRNINKIKMLLAESGFEQQRVLPTNIPLQSSLIIAS